MNVISNIYSLPNKGNLAWEYNPLHNYLINLDVYIIEENGMQYLIPKNCAADKDTGEILTLNKDTNQWVNSAGDIIDRVIDPEEYKETRKLCTEYSLVDLDTKQLKFDLNHPVEIEALPSYDGSVNLILNDNKNIPRLINTRFSVKEKNTYEIVDRIGENDTNIYSADSFDKDTSLYFLYNSNPIIAYNSYTKGNLPVGSYCFYLTYCDSDDNESDYVAESGLIPVFLGTERNPNSMNGGIKNLNSDKGIKLKVSNLESTYNYIKVYYVRYFADYLENRVFECKKIYRKYPINNTTQYLQITGNEEVEEIDANILNLSRFNPKSVLTQAQCKNMLFFGNIVKNTDNYKELSDIALRIIPILKKDTIQTLGTSYEGNNAGYYSTYNIYNKTGYFNQEYYRFGVVFIYNNGTLSNVYNTLGRELIDKDDSLDKVNDKLGKITKENIRLYITVDDFGWIDSSLNARGVCKINCKEEEDSIYGISFHISDDIINHLTNVLEIRGLFFVRQKCIPNILALCLIFPMDKILEAPVIKVENDYLAESFVLQEGKNYLISLYSPRLIKIKLEPDTKAYAAICPDFLLNLPYYNLIFNGSSFKLKKVYSGKLKQSSLIRMYELKENLYGNNSESYANAIINSVTSDVPTVVIKDKVYRSKIGHEEEVYRFRYVGVDNGAYDLGKKDKDKNNTQEDQINAASNIVRGYYSPYLAIYLTGGQLEFNCVYNIYQDSYEDSVQEYLKRMDSHEPFYAISDRLNLSQIKDNKVICFRGDCYINNFTYRLNRNFLDASLPNNDKIIETNTWIDNYKILDLSKLEKINKGDVNAVPLGSWITFKVRSSMNYALRSEDHSFVNEKAEMGAPRSFYPKSHLLYRGENKIPDSYLFNDAFRATLGFKCYFTLDNINYLKDTFSNRVLYSAISILDSYKNNYRYSLSTYFRDYSTEYGSITRLIPFDGYLLIVFEHAIGIAVINERVLMGGEGEPIFINTLNVLPEELDIITDTYGSQWSESIVKSESGYVYGVDTVAKKIWRVKGQNLEILSDLKVNKFLVDNLNLTEREIYPYIGIKNVKTHYNNNKKDIMFTFYNEIYKDEEKVWNLCYNEIMNLFITFYSWVPSYSANIDNIFFSFNRESSKLLALLNNSNSKIEENTGVLVTPIEDNKWELSYLPEEENIHFEVLEDHWGFNKSFNKVIKNGKYYLEYDSTKLGDIFKEHPVILLYILPSVNTESNNKYQNLNNSKLSLKAEVIALSKTIKSKSDFYVHGKAGIFDIADTIKPCYWYEKLHPFEFEFVVNTNSQFLKIWNNLLIISNKAIPESFHFEIEGDNYDFSNDKRNMYYRQESTKETYLNLGSNIIFDRDYLKVSNTNFDSYTNKDFNGLVQNPKSTIFPLYYNRIDTYDNIYDLYKLMESSSRNYENLSGSEIAYDKDLDLFNIITHVKNNPIDIVGRFRGNSHYKEGKWNILIPSISYMQKNEDSWKVPPIVINYLPEDIKEDSMLGVEHLPNTYTNLDLVSVEEWTYRKETRIRDKWIKIKVRYSGRELAIIHSLITLYNISYG